MTRVVTVRALAKINLGLRVKGIRPDGYHDLQTVFQAVDLADMLTFRAAGGSFRLSCSGADTPADDRNLVWRAAVRLWTAMGRAGAPEGVSVSIRKRIPPGAGLGGGSADAAAALRTLSRLWRSRLPQTDVEAIAADLGADVPYFLCGGTALGLGRGDEIYPLVDLPRLSVVIAFPAFGVATSDAFRWFDADARPGEAGHPPAGDSAARTAIWQPDGARLVNDLEAPVVRRHPVIGEMIDRLRGVGATAAAMSGSGSAVYGLFPDARRASRAAAQLRGGGWTALATRTLTRRESAGALVSRAPGRID